MIDPVLLRDQSIQECEPDIVDISNDQMLHGFLGDGSKIGQYRDPKYAAFKYAENSLAGFGNVDLHLEGGFYEGKYIKQDDSTISIESTDDKATALTSKYGLGIWELTPDNKGTLARQFILPTINEKLRQQARL